MAAAAREVLHNCSNDCPTGLPVVDDELITYLKSLPEDYWDFVEYEKKYTHFIHTYPAMMIPPIPEAILKIMKRYQPGIKNLLDPFMGSGTVLLEGVLSNVNVWGVDLNPLACLLAKAKCTPIDPDLLKAASTTLLEKIGADMHNDVALEKPQFQNIDYWFKDYVIRDLQVIKQNIKEIEDKDLKALFFVAFSQTVRDCSNTRNNEFKLYRIPEERLGEFNPSVLDTFRSHLEKCGQGMAELYERYRGGCNVTVVAADTRHFSLDEQMDLLITSPPYGDSRTTVAYGQFSRLSLQWLDLEEYDYVSSQIDKEKLDKYLLGGMNGGEDHDLPSESLKEALDRIAGVDKKRAADVLSFYVDLNKCLANITAHMKVNSYQFWVVGNRTVKKVNLPTDAIISELGVQYGLKTVAIIPRSISNKRMPSENSPTNEKGKKVPTMTKEHIVVLRKER
ncbi:MAG TPA: DNA methylase [Clostridia bacterium]|nr:DNA methylase [Clostridia bacterium]